MLAGVLKKEMS